MPSTMRLPAFALLVCGLAGLARAAEPVGCDKFKWPLSHERQLLQSTDKIQVSAITSRAVDPNAPKAVELKLARFKTAKLSMTPERAPKDENSFAGLAHFGAPAKPSAYKLTLSDAAWADIIQDGKFVPSVAFTGATGCSGVRKSVKFELSAAPFVVQISGASRESIALVLTPAE